MKKILRKYFLLILITLIIIPANAIEIEDVLKDDFSKQHTVLIKFEVNKRLYSFEAGKFKLEKISKNRDKINNITKKIIPWSIMEGLSPEEVARIIVYMYYAEDAGANFLDSEDLIPLVAQKDIPLLDFVLMVQYIKETKKGGIPQGIRESLIGEAFRNNWDGLSILAAGRGLLIAKRYGYNINKAATYLLNNVPGNSKNLNSRQIVRIITAYLGKKFDKNITTKLVTNFEEIHKIASTQSPSPQELRQINNIGLKIDFLTQRIQKIVIPKKPKRNKIIDKQIEIIPEPDPVVVVKPSGKHWTILSKNNLNNVIQKWLGTPYRYGAKTGRPGIDCSGFTRIVLINNIIGVPTSKIGIGTIRQRHNGKPVKRTNLRAGDLIFFSASTRRNKITHVGLVSSNNTFAHASSSRGVVYDKINKKYWRKRYVMSRRIFKQVEK